MLATQLELKKELEETKKELAKANEELYNKTWQLKHAHFRLNWIMNRDPQDITSLNLLLCDLSTYIAE